MAFAVERITDHRPFTDDDPAALSRSGIWVSPNNRWLASINDASSDHTMIAVADLRDLYVVQNWNIGTIYFNPLVDVTSLDTHAGCIDDDGSLWMVDGDASGDVFELTLGSIPTPVYRFTLASGGGGDPYWFRVATPFTMPDGSTQLIFVESSDVEVVFDYHVYDKSAGTYSHVTLAWLPQCAFQDDNGDIWLCGVDDVEDGAITTAQFKRLTDVTGASAYAEEITFTGLPDISNHAGQNQSSIWGAFVGGSFVGGWMAGQNKLTDVSWRGDECNYLIRLDLTTEAGAFADISATAPVSCSWGMSKALIPRETSLICLQLLNAGQTDTQTRDFAFFDTATLAKTADYNLDDWAAGDDITGNVIPMNGSLTSLSHEAWGHQFLYAREAFIAQSFGNGYFNLSDVDEETQKFGKLWLYYLEDAPVEEGDGLVDESVRIRVWPYSLDGDDFAIFRLGPSESLVYNLSTGTWASWASPGRENWRAHVGQNWVGMSTATLANGFGSDVVAGDDASGTLFILDPTSGRDDRSTTGDDPFDRVVTGGISLSGRETAPCGALQLDYSTGNPTQEGATFTLETSDDWAHTFDSQGTVTVTAADFTGVVEWRGLGLAKAPGRVFRITDNGAAVRLSGADLR